MTLFKVCCASCKLLYAIFLFFSYKIQTKINSNRLLKKKFLKFNNVEQLHFELTNIVYIAREKDESWYYFCDEITCCCFKQKKCTLCLFCKEIFKKDLIDNIEPTELLLRNRENIERLREFVNLIWPFFQKMVILNKRSLQFFNDEYRWSMCNNQEGTTSSLTMKEIIKSNIKLVELNGIERYCKFNFS